MQTLKDPKGTVCGQKPNKLTPYAKIVALALAIFVALSCFFYLNSHFAKIISGSSMCPTLNADFGGQKDIVLVNKFKKAEKEDIVIVNVKKLEYFDARGTKLLVKRVVATGGDGIKLVNNSTTNQNEVWLKNSQHPEGTKLDEDYIIPDNDTHIISIFDSQANWITKCDVDADGYTLIPDGYVFCMGDNRGVSLDSRYVGPFEEERVLGVVDGVVYDKTFWHDVVATLFQFDLNF